MCAHDWVAIDGTFSYTCPAGGEVFKAEASGAGYYIKGKPTSKGSGYWASQFSRPAANKADGDRALYSILPLDDAEGAWEITPLVDRFVNNEPVGPCSFDYKVICNTPRGSRQKVFILPVAATPAFPTLSTAGTFHFGESWVQTCL